MKECKGRKHDLIINATTWTHRDLDVSTRLSACCQGTRSCRGARTARLRSDLVARSHGARSADPCKLATGGGAPHRRRYPHPPQPPPRSRGGGRPPPKAH